MTFKNSRTPGNRKSRRRAGKRQSSRSQGAGRDLFMVIGVFVVLALIFILGLAYFGA